MTITQTLKGTRQTANALAGRGLLQSPQEWEARNTMLAQTLCELIREHAPQEARAGLDVGAELGGLTERFTRLTALHWKAVDPDITEPATSPCGVEMVSAYGHSMPFDDESFDVVSFVNVFEHVSPEWREPTVREFRRVLRKNGVLVGQLPNPYFPIESHSRLPFFGLVPRRLQPLYWKLTPTPWDYEAAHFFTVTVRLLRKLAEQNGFETLVIRNFNYPSDAIPKSVRKLAELHNRLGILPWAWQFVFRKI
jgi:SAM-dependent methyltransferase